jgi:hypothetical protein
VAIDGSKFKAISHRDRKETPSSPRQVTRLKDRTGTLKQEMRRLRAIKVRMDAFQLRQTRMDCGPPLARM